MTTTLVEIVQPQASAVIDVRVVVTLDDGRHGSRVYSFDADVPFDEIMKRIGVVIDSTLKVVLRAPLGSLLWRGALRSTDSGPYVLDHVAAFREVLNGDVVQLEQDRDHLKRCLAKGVFGQ